MYALVSMNVLCGTFGLVCVKWWIPRELARRNLPNPDVRRGNTGAELLFIVLHNGLVASFSVVCFLVRSPRLAMYIFCFEIGHEVFDALAVNRRLDPETILHHVFAPLVMFASMQTTVDVRVLCTLCFGVDFSGACLGYMKYILRYQRPQNPQRLYRLMSYIYVPCRVIIPWACSLLIWWDLYHMDPIPSWSQNYAWAMCLLNALNFYFCIVIISRSRSANNRIHYLEDMEEKYTR